jgi:hypothetical protein
MKSMDSDSYIVQSVRCTEVPPTQTQKTSSIVYSIPDKKHSHADQQSTIVQVSLAPSRATESMEITTSNARFKSSGSGSEQCCFVQFHSNPGRARNEGALISPKVACVKLLSISLLLASAPNITSQGIHKSKSHINF